ncbi:MAG: ATP-dependent RNA helicase [Faecalicatena sp.]|uniref:ATP-dependent RNA helicase n=1 Tax=Faecalicatena sp. TaxID=2005360 RepID=UPI0025843094|nr:ATP-dependent RNA helicase [Faecalicatena sp.]MCI6466888.1 ATP-dependent RNA helicase [Faecalicatena sp.]MDY5617596.1 ATP-dependent RNA helicase [Lachnospiraceae bacterium]
MSSKKNSTSIFDDDFEVTYEEEIPFSYSFDTKPVSKGATDETVVMAERDFDEVDYEDSYEDDYDEDYGDSYEDEYDDQYENDYYDQDYEEDDYDYDRDAPRRKRKKRKGSSGNGARLLSPVKKTAKYGTKAIYRTARSVVRIISALITAGTFCALAYNFWRGAAPYGDPQKILTDQNFALAAYAGVAAVILLFELISFFWSLTKMKFREGRKIYKEDTGRGLFSFIFIYIASYLSFLLCSFLPDTLGSYDVLNGLKGALDVYGSLHNVLLGLCLAGAISCLVRRHMN